MAKSTDPVLLALLATLEQQAEARGKKSIVKGVVARLADAGANPGLVAEIAALQKRKTGAAKARTAVDAPAPHPIEKG